MTIEEKAKAYDEAIEKTSKLINEGCLNRMTGEFIFPKLKESEDERIRKLLIGVVELYYGNTDDKEKKDCLAWLEKRGEQKSTNKVEPKFHEGDIIRHKEQGFTCKIIAVDTEYRLSECNGTHLPFDCQDAYELVEQKPAWSEDDDKHIMAIDLSVQRCDGKWHCCGEQCPISEHIPFLKSLKDRYTWKPSEGQLECLGYAIEKAEKNWSPLANNRIYLTLKALKEQLEKL